MRISVDLTHEQYRQLHDLTMALTRRTHERDASAPAHTIERTAALAVEHGLLELNRLWYRIELAEWLNRGTPPERTCPACGGNDRDMPCAYPSEGRPGCLRDARLTAPAAPERPAESGEAPCYWCGRPTLVRIDALNDAQGRHECMRADCVRGLPRPSDPVSA
jgi:hypothetical protein